MRTKIFIGLLTVTAILAWTVVAGAQTAPATPKLQLPSGETVWDLSGDWDAFVENYGPWARFGIYPTVWRITQTGSAVNAIRVKENPAPSPGQAGSPSLQGELDRDGFKRVAIVSGVGTTMPCRGQISEDGKKIILDDGITARVTLTRSGDRTPLVGLWRLVAFQREYQATGEREYPMGGTATGYILFLPEGRMWVVITGEGRKAPTTDQDGWVYSTPWSRTRGRTAWTARSGSRRWRCPRTPPGWARSKPGRFNSAATASKRRRLGRRVPTTEWQGP